MHSVHGGTRTTSQKAGAAALVTATAAACNQRCRHGKRNLKVRNTMAEEVAMALPATVTIKAQGMEADTVGQAIQSLDGR
jgi:hypothetical protein